MSIARASATNGKSSQKKPVNGKKPTKAPSAAARKITADVLEVGEIWIRDKTGTPRIAIGVDSNGAAIFSMFDKSQKQMVTISVEENGDKARLRVCDHHGKVAIEGTAHSGQNMDDDAIVYFGVNNFDKEVELSMDDEGNGAIEFVEEGHILTMAKHDGFHFELPCTQSAKERQAASTVASQPQTVSNDRKRYGDTWLDSAALLRKSARFEMISVEGLLQKLGVDRPKQKGQVFLGDDRLLRYSTAENLLHGNEKDTHVIFEVLPEMDFIELKTDFHDFGGWIGPREYIARLRELENMSGSILNEIEQLIAT